MSAFVTVWRFSKILPTPVIRAFAGTAAWAAWALKAKPVTRLESNLTRVTDLKGRALRRLSRRSMASAARYYAEVLELPRVSGASIDARVRLVNEVPVREVLEGKGRIVIALSHSGNWDLIGAYSCRNLAPVTSVAEILKPQAVFDEFVAFRQSLGMTIFGHEGSTTFRKMIAAAQSQGGVLALVADRDMSGRGVEATMWGHPVRVAAGPAALAVATGSDLVGLMVHYERLSGERRRRAKSRWGIVATFSPLIEAPEGNSTAQVSAMTHAWVQFMSNGIAEHPEDWHMLQRFGWAE